LILAAVLMMLAGFSYGATEVIVDGVGADRATALNDAQRNAIATVVGQVVDSQTLVSNYALVSDRILTSSTGYLKTYQVENEGPDASGYRVRIRAVVETANITNDINAIAVLSAKRDNPRFIVLPDPSPLGEKFDPSDDAVKQAALGIREYLSERQLVVIDAPAYNVKTGMTSPSAMRDLSMWGAGLGAEYVVYFSVQGMPSGSGRTFKKATAMVDVSIVHTGTYQVVAQEEGKAIGSDREEKIAYRKAGRNAGKNAAEAALDQVLQNWARGGSTAGNVINLTIQNVEGNVAHEFEEMLQRSGSVKMSQMTKLDNKVATFKVTLDGGLSDMANALGSICSEKKWNWALVASDGSSLTYQIPFEVKMMKDEVKAEATMDMSE
jgi:hypothetical protein